MNTNTKNALQILTYNADKPRSGDGACDAKGCEPVRVARLLRDLCGGFRALERVHGLQESEQDDQPVTRPARRVLEVEEHEAWRVPVRSLGE